MTDAAPAAAEIDAVLAGPDEEALRKMSEWATAGSPEAQTILGQMLMDGRGGPADPVAGFGWFLKAARAGRPMAANMVGRCYENGWGVTPSDEAATSWFAQAAHAGLDWGMYNFATSLALGRGVAENKVAARAWLEKAVALGHAKSMTVLGGFHEDGWAGPVDTAQARSLYERGAAGGDFRGAFNVGRLLVEDGRAAEASSFFQTAWRTGTPAFRDNLLSWLESRAEPTLQGLRRALQAGR